MERDAVIRAMKVIGREATAEKILEHSQRFSREMGIKDLRVCLEDLVEEGAARKSVEGKNVFYRLL